MNNSLLFDFSVDKQAKKAFVTRAFEADQQLVWDAFTKQEILDQWWAPKPWISRTKHMNFEVGGRRFYAMCSPEGEEHWGTQDYTSITAITNFKLRSAFSDKDENINQDMPHSEWNHDFSQQGAVTTVAISIKHDTLESLEQIIAMGFQGGFTMTLNYLEELLNDIKTK